MLRSKECRCYRGMANSTEIEFVIISSRIDLRCRKCNGMVRWWQEDTKKIRPFIRGWPDEECSAMR